jgi:DNA-binding MarR family transcriptional regulator
MERDHPVVFERGANLLGALSLAVSDRMSEAVAAAAGQSQTAAAALSALYHFLDAPSVDLLRQVLGLTSSGTVRLLDRLQASGYVTRGAGRDGRSTAVMLTPAGREAAERVSAARARLLEVTLAPLSDAERATFEALVSKLLVGMMREPGAVRWTCRLCDTGTCRAEPGDCPFRIEARRRYGV